MNISKFWDSKELKVVEIIFGTISSFSFCWISKKNNVRKLAKIIIDNKICTRFHFTRNKIEQKRRDIKACNIKPRHMIKNSWQITKHLLANNLLVPPQLIRQTISHQLGTWVTKHLLVNKKLPTLTIEKTYILNFLLSSSTQV